MFANTQEVVDKVIPHPLVMIASDGAEGHPRNAGTYSRVLAQYVREKGSITLMDAIRKMSLMPAQTSGEIYARRSRQGTSAGGSRRRCRRFRSRRPSPTAPPISLPWKPAPECSL